MPFSGIFASRPIPRASSLSRMRRSVPRKWRLRSATSPSRRPPPRPRPTSPRSSASCDPAYTTGCSMYYVALHRPSVDFSRPIPRARSLSRKTGLCRNKWTTAIVRLRSRRRAFEEDVRTTTPQLVPSAVPFSGSFIGEPFSGTFASLALCRAFRPALRRHTADVLHGSLCILFALVCSTIICGRPRA